MLNSMHSAKHNKQGIMTTIVHSRSVDPRKLRVGVKYYIVHMYSMPYYTHGSTANFFILRAYSASKERCCNEDLRGVGNLKIE